MCTRFWSDGKYAHSKFPTQHWMMRLILNYLDDIMCVNATNHDPRSWVMISFSELSLQADAWAP